MNTFTIDDLKTHLGRTVGDDEEVDLSGDILDVTFSELGFDSLALIETTSRVEQEYHISLPEGDFAMAETPRELLSLVADALNAAVAG